MEDLSGKVKYDAILLLNHKNPNSHDSWDADDAQVACRMLGFNNSLPAIRTRSSFGQGLIDTDTIHAILNYSI